MITPTYCEDADADVKDETDWCFLRKLSDDKSTPNSVKSNNNKIN
jgi:hypothetical protein